MFSEWTGATYAVSTINGTETMTLALKAAGIGPGDEVITPTFTFVADRIDRSAAPRQGQNTPGRSPPAITG